MNQKLQQSSPILGVENGIQKNDNQGELFFRCLIMPRFIPSLAREPKETTWFVGRPAELHLHLLTQLLPRYYLTEL
jgi:hypothetical protein